MSTRVFLNNFMTEIENLYDMKEIFEVEVIPPDLITTCNDVYFVIQILGCILWIQVAVN